MRGGETLTHPHRCGSTKRCCRCCQLRSFLYQNCNQQRLNLIFRVYSSEITPSQFMVNCVGLFWNLGWFLSIQYASLAPVTCTDMSLPTVNTKQEVSLISSWWVAQIHLKSYLLGKKSATFSHHNSCFCENNDAMYGLYIINQLFVR